MTYEPLYALKAIQRAVDEMAREEDYSPEDAQKRIVELLAADRKASLRKAAGHRRPA